MHTATIIRRRRSQENVSKPSLDVVVVKRACKHNVAVEEGRTSLGSSKGVLKRLGSYNGSICWLAVNG